MNKALKVVVVVVFALFALVPKSFSQMKYDRDEVYNVLRQLKNYRYGEISVFEIRQTDELKAVLKSNKQDVGGPKKSDLDKCAKESTPELKKYCRDGYLNGSSISDVQKAINDDAKIPQPTDDQVDCLLKFYADSLGGTSSNEVFHGYIITTPLLANQSTLPEIIGFIVVRNTEDDDSPLLDKNLKSVDPDNIFSNRRLDTMYVDMSGQHKKLKEVLENYILQDNVEDKTLEARSIDALANYVARTVGNTRTLVDDEADIRPKDTQQFIRVSEGQPEDYFLIENELTVGSDLIRWREYDINYVTDKNGKVKLDSLKNPIIDSTFAVNNMFSPYGIELKYGMEDINLPSLWTQRLTLSGIFENFKIGVIIPPTNYASSAAKSFGNTPTLTYGNLGFALSGDFPFKVLPKTGVFNFSINYVFSDPVQSSNMVGSTATTPYGISDYLIRFNGQLLYTFGMKIDNDYQLRFGVGASLYDVEEWSIDTNHITKKPFVDSTYKKYGQETVGGIAGRIDFMAKSTFFPWGLSAQYFDETFWTDIWAQKTIIDKALLLRFDVNAFINTFKTTLRPWEPKSIFMPSIKLIFLI